MNPDSKELAAKLATYLGAPLSSFRILAGGWETTVFEFNLAGVSSRLRDVPISQPLVLRFYQASHADDKATREAATMRLMADIGYPVPRPYLFEPDHDPIGAPFLIMERVAGRPLFSIASFPIAFKTFSLGFIAFVRAQTRLHRIRPNGSIRLDSMPQAFRTSSGPNTAPLLQRVLKTIDDRIEQGPLPGLQDALSRLRECVSRFCPGPETLVHLDYHPQNVLVRGPRVTGVIDWVNADHGDRYLCAATTAVILSSSAMEQPRWMRDNVVGNSLRALFASLYVPLYNSLAPMDLARFRFAQGVAALLRLSMFGMMRLRGPESVGFRPEAGTNVTPAVVRLLSRYTSRKIGVEVSI
ncbi:MAG: phosphotransferase [Deltaproteobacteria bacterium]|nr:phosphotransferase [Deltaproteobacteria bacterium]